MKNHTQVLAYCNDQELAELGAKVVQAFPDGKIKLIKGPSQGLVMLRQRETVANSLFNAGEILVTEVHLELDGQFGFGMVIGDRPQAALAIALVEAALNRPGNLAEELGHDVDRLAEALEQQRRDDYRRVASTKVAFEIF